MIRSAASRIDPGPEDINYHLNRVLMRHAARYQAYSPAPSSGYESVGSWHESEQEEDHDYDYDYDYDQEQEQSEDGDSTTGSCVIHKEQEQEQEQEHTYTCRYLALLQQSQSRFTALPRQKQTHSLPLSGYSQVSSLRVLFETLSLNSLSSHSLVRHYFQSKSRRQRQSQSQVESEHINLKMTKDPQSDIAMKDAPALSTGRRGSDAIKRGESTSGSRVCL